jgi:hypothetical protein
MMPEAGPQPELDNAPESVSQASKAEFKGLVESLSAEHDEPYVLGDGRIATVRRPGSQLEPYSVVLTDLGLSDEGRPYEVKENYSLSPTGQFRHFIDSAITTEAPTPASPAASASLKTEVELADLAAETKIDLVDESEARRINQLLRELA